MAQFYGSNGTYIPVNPDSLTDGSKGGGGGNSLANLLKAIVGNPYGGKLPPWATMQPKTPNQLMRQLSGNAGQFAMPMGPVGAVRAPAYGMGGKPQMGLGGTSYGQQPNMGEATFFQQSMRGGMAPIAAMSALGVPKGWQPFKGYKPGGGKKDDDKGGGKKPSGNGGGQNNTGGSIRPGGVWTMPDLSDMGK